MSTILQGVVGSTAYGLATPDSDVDRLAVHVGPLRDVLSFGITSPSKVTTKPDMTSHEVSKFVGLCMKGNPSVTELLWLPEYEVETVEGLLLVKAREKFLSAKRIHDAYGGYAFHQLHRLLNRNAEGKEGFSADTKKRTGKHARHLIRLLIQGRQLLNQGHLTVRLTSPQAEQCWYVGRAAEAGEYDVVRNSFDYYLARLDKAYEHTDLPREPDREAAKDLLVQIRRLSG